MMFKKLLIAGVGALLATFGAVAGGSASSTVSWSATFAEVGGGPIHSPFVCPAGESCGSGQVVGLGQAQDVIVFRAGCGGACDIRTLTFSDGSQLVMDETASNLEVPGNSSSAPSTAYGHPVSLTLAEVIDPAASTGRFAGATGTAAGGVKVAGGVAIIRLSGSLTFA